MHGNSVAEVLRALAIGDKSRSETARLRDVFDGVEAALSAGVSRAAVLEALHGQGFTITAKSFESALYRIRKKKKGGAPATIPVSVPATGEIERNPFDVEGSDAGLVRPPGISNSAWNELQVKHAKQNRKQS